MKVKIQKAILIQQYGGQPIVKTIPIPQLKDGQVLIKVDASPINPSDKLLIDGTCFQKPLPFICGLQGTGWVIDAVGQIASLWIGVRVSFVSLQYGAWVQYSVSTPYQIFEIDQDISIVSASCGIINPLTTIAILQKYKQKGCQYGLINTAACSSLGKMLIKMCNKQNIPLLNIVRKEHQKQKLQKLGAKHIIVTTKDWTKQYQKFIQMHKFDCLFDCLGGGPITEALISPLRPYSKIFMYGTLEDKPIVITSTLHILKSLSIQGFLIFSWLGNCSEQLQQKIRQNHNTYLRNQLSTTCIKQLYFQNIQEGLDLSIKMASQGKVILRMQRDF